MLVYTIKRLLALIPTLLAASILVFLFIHLIPGDPAAILLGDSATPEEVAALAVMLASPKVHYLSGTVIDMDGGGQWTGRI